MESKGMKRSGLAKGRYVTFADGENVEVRCEQGGVWVTQANHHRDVCLSAGERFVSRSKDLVLVYAFRPSVLSTTTVPVRPAAAVSWSARVVRTMRETGAVLRLAVSSARHYAF